jgi:hypothetical protein
VCEPLREVVILGLRFGDSWFEIELAAFLMQDLKLIERRESVRQFICRSQFRRLPIQCRKWVC